MIDLIRCSLQELGELLENSYYNNNNNLYNILHEPIQLG